MFISGFSFDLLHHRLDGRFLSCFLLSSFLTEKSVGIFAFVSSMPLLGLTVAVVLMALLVWETTLITFDLPNHLLFSHLPFPSLD